MAFQEKTMSRKLVGFTALFILIVGSLLLIISHRSQSNNQINFLAIHRSAHKFLFGVPLNPPKKVEGPPQAPRPEFNEEQERRIAEARAKQAKDLQRREQEHRRGQEQRQPQFLMPTVDNPYQLPGGIEIEKPK
jgi:hypothetical protein